MRPSVSRSNTPPRASTPPPPPQEPQSPGMSIIACNHPLALGQRPGAVHLPCLGFQMFSACLLVPARPLCQLLMALEDPPGTSSPGTKKNISPCGMTEVPEVIFVWSQGRNKALHTLDYLGMHQNVSKCVVVVELEVFDVLFSCNNNTWLAASCMYPKSCKAKSLRN